MSTELSRVAERAKRGPDYKFYSLAHLIDVECLRRAYLRLKKDAAVGVDEVTVEEYGEELENHLRDLHARMKSGRYRHQPIRRVHIPKGKGKMRPIGISCVEDKIVQGALREVLEAVYEATFLDCSLGFRPKRSPHDAIRALQKLIDAGKANVLLEADIVSFFDKIDRKILLEMLQKRVADGSIKRLVGKCLHVGVLEGEEYSEPDEGTAQGSIISPLLGNIYLHYVLDEWFENEVRPRMKGEANLVRYADDFIMVFERQDDAERVWEVLGKRFGRFGLSLHPEKTRIIRYQKPSRDQKGGKGPGTFDFLGFTWYWRRVRSGGWRSWCKTRRAKLRQAIREVYKWCKWNRHLPVAEQHGTLGRKIRGHVNYFGVSGNYKSVAAFCHFVTKAWFKWLTRRSNRCSLTWERFEEFLKVHPLPGARIRFRIWGT